MTSEGITRAHVVRAWRAFAHGNMRRDDVQEFAFDLEAHLEQLYQELTTWTYRHGPYHVFVRCDPKRRVIAVPSVRDQIVHRLLVEYVGPTFERTFHPHSYASRPEKGVLAAVETVHRWIRDASDGGRKRCFSLRMDIASFFASVDHVILLALLCRRVPEQWMWLCARVLTSFGDIRGGRRCGLPLGNVTSQLFANVYLNELDRFVAYGFHMRRYARYMDDWIMVGRDRTVLEEIAVQYRAFLRDGLRLDAPDRKTLLVSVTRGVDWLGFVLFPHHRVLRLRTMRRMRGQIRSRVFAYLDDGLSYDRLRATFASYDGLLRNAAHQRERDRLLALQRTC